MVRQSVVGGRPSCDVVDGAVSLTLVGGRPSCDMVDGAVSLTQLMQQLLQSVTLPFLAVRK